MKRHLDGLFLVALLGMITVTKPASAAVLGTRKVLVVLVNLTSDPSQPLTIAQAQTSFGHINAIYQDQSYDQLTLSATVTGYFTLNVPSPCSLDLLSRATAIIDRGNTALAAAGIDKSAYSDVMFVTPNPLCGSGGGIAGFSDLYINGWGEQVIAHELGHRYGLLHARSFICGDIPFDPDWISDGGICGVYEYGDWTDVMGTGFAFSAPEKERLGWIAVSTITRNGTYTLPSMESTGASPKALKIVSSGGGGEGYAYYLQFDQPGRGAPWYTSNSNVFRGITVRIMPDFRTSPTLILSYTYLLNMHPTDISLGNVALEVGESYTDPSGRFNFRVVSISSTSAQVRVDFADQQGLPEDDNPSGSQNVHVFPNPWRADNPSSFGIAFQGLSPSAKVTLFSLKGQAVKTLTAGPDGQVNWDLTNYSSDKVASGLYLYLITSPQGEKVRGKLSILR